MKKIVALIFILLFCEFLNSQNDKKRGTFIIKRNAIFEFDRGENVFISNCLGCHTAYPYHKDERPWTTYLIGVTKKRTTAWLFSFIKYPEFMLQSGDKDIIEINKQVRRVTEKYDALRDIKAHPSFYSISLSEINAIFFYIDSLNSRKVNFEKGMEIDGHK